MTRLSRTVLLVLPALLVLGLLGPGATPAAAVTGKDFRPGNIISDAVFFNAGTMTAANIQSFLRAKHPGCRSGYVCLPDYRVDTASRAADAQCGAYAGAQDELASRVLHKVARACGINPKVLLVLLQKETSLITKSDPTYRNAYRKATGYGCPDTAPCDAQYYGFYNQVYKAAWQYKRYANNPGNYSYRPGRTNYIQWHPNAACGGSNVYIENRATAALYIYTPYQPNKAALDNLLGTGNSCSSYGNRNFWRLFNDWFGSTHSGHEVSGEIGTLYYEMGGPSGALGDILGPPYVTAGGGAAQVFRNGRIHWSPATGAHAVVTEISQRYNAEGGEAGSLGYPIGARRQTLGGGYTQDFQRGRIHWSPTTGAHAVFGDIGVVYDSMQGEGGALGYPVGGRRATAGGGLTQDFQNGHIHWSPVLGAHPVLAPIVAAYDAVGGESGPLGYPAGRRYLKNNAVQKFERGRIHYSSATGAHAVIGELSATYDRLRGEAGPLGFPLAGRRTTAAGGWTQDFQNGRIHFLPSSGAHAVLSPIAAHYDGLRGEAGVLGYPLGAAYDTAAGHDAQNFQGGVVIVRSGGAQIVDGDIGRVYAGLGGAKGVLGEPDGAAAGGVQAFEGGRILDGPETSAQAVAGDMWTAYDATGAEDGPLGWPVAAEVTAEGATVQRFENATLVLSSGTTRRVDEPLAGAWWTAGGPNGGLGLPTGGARAAAGGGTVQSFAGGIVLSQGPTRTHAVVGDLATAYARYGGEGGDLGYPVGDRRTTARGGLTQDFENGRIHWTQATGAHAVFAPISAAYDPLQGESGPLGYPVRDRRATPGGGWTQDFEDGRIHWTTSTGAHAVFAPISGSYDNLSGESGPLGYPTGGRRATAGGGWTQDFQHGRIHWSPTTGAHDVTTPVSTAYDRLRGEAGPLGYPLGHRRATASSGLTQDFQRGRIHWSPSTGAHAVLPPVAAAYDARRGESGVLGYPTGAQRTSSTGVVRQNFQGGVIRVAPGRAPVVVLR